MAVKNLMAVALVLLFGLGQVGCSTSQQPAQDHAQQPGADHNHHEHSTDPAKSAPANTQVAKAIQDELNGLASIEKEVNKGDFKAATATFEDLHEEYHAGVLAPIKAKKGDAYANNMHSKFDALDDAISKKDKNSILNMVKANREALNTAAKDLGVSVK